MVIYGGKLGLERYWENKIDSFWPINIALVVYNCVAPSPKTQLLVAYFDLANFKRFFKIPNIFKLSAL